MFVIIVAIEIDFKLTYLWRIKDHLTEKSEARMYVYPLQVSEQQNQNNKQRSYVLYFDMQFESFIFWRKLGTIPCHFTTLSG